MRLQIFIFAVEWPHCKIVLRDLDLLFEGKKCKTLISLKWLELALKCIETTFVDDLPTNSPIVKIVLYDFDLLF